jgi:acetyl esterase/lipase
MQVAVQVDPELVAPLEGFLTAMGGGVNLHDIPALRTTFAQLTAALNMELPPFEGVTSEDQQVRGAAGAPDVAVRIYQPTERPATLPALLWIHGGAYVMGGVEDDDLYVKELVKAVECVVVSVEYRLAPEHPFPAAIEDCYAALKWLATHAAELGVEQERIAIGGASAGGGLTAGLALLARDRAEVNVAFQLLICPVIDDRNITQASETVPDTLLWSRENNLMSWRYYLGAEPGGQEVSPYAAAFRANDVTGLPATYIAVGELDLFLHENIEYAQRLLEAGVSTELHVYPGAYHGFELVAPTSTVGQRFTADRNDALKHALQGSRNRLSTSS